MTDQQDEPGHDAPSARTGRYDACTGEPAEIGETAWHATYGRLLGRILARGLSPYRDANGRDPHIYVFADHDAAVDFARRYLWETVALRDGSRICRRPKADARVIEIVVDGLRFEPDPGLPPLPHAFRWHGGLPASRIIGVEEVDRWG
jgi:hypothetical protein